MRFKLSRIDEREFSIFPVIFCDKKIRQLLNVKVGDFAYVIMNKRNQTNIYVTVVGMPKKTDVGCGVVVDSKFAQVAHLSIGDKLKVYKARSTSDKVNFN